MPIVLSRKGGGASGGGAPSGPAGGDLTGTYPNPTIGAGKVTAAQVAADVATQAELVAGDSVSPIYVLANIGYTVVAAVWSYSAQDSQPYRTTLLSDNAQNAEVTYGVGLSAGTYTLQLLHITDTLNGIYTVALDGSTIATFDGYAAGATFNVRTDVAGIVVAASGIKTLSVKMATKNAASSNYRAIWTLLAFIRTA